MTDLQTIANKASSEIEERIKINLTSLMKQFKYDLLPKHTRRIEFKNSTEADLFEEICELEDVPCHRDSETICYLGGSYEILFVEFGDSNETKNHPWSVEMMKKYDK